MLAQLTIKVLNYSSMLIYSLQAWATEVLRDPSESLCRGAQFREM